MLYSMGSDNSIYMCRLKTKQNKINSAFTQNYVLFILATIVFVHFVFVQEIVQEIMKA